MSASRWATDALRAWTEEDYERVAAFAPIAVELLGKAVLWGANPVLLVPLNENAERSLVELATNPTLASPKMRTIGLGVVLRRLERVLGALPMDAARRARLVDTRNGAMHAGTAREANHVLVDALSLLWLCLERLDQPAAAFYGAYADSAEVLIDRERTEVARRVAGKMARARRRLTELEERLGEEVFRETTDRLEAEAEYVFAPGLFGSGLEALTKACPECGSAGRLFGYVDLTPEVDFEAEAMGGGEYETVYTSYWDITLSPDSFACNVCQLILSGHSELNECGMAAVVADLSPSDLGDEFEPAAVAEGLYGSQD